MGGYGVDGLQRDKYVEIVRTREAQRRRDARQAAVPLLVLCAVVVAVMGYALREPVIGLLSHNDVVVEAVVPTVHAYVEITYSEENEKFLLRLRTYDDVALAATFRDANGVKVTSTLSTRPGDYTVAASAAYVDLDTLKRIESVSIELRNGGDVNAVGAVGDDDVWRAREDAIHRWSQTQGRLAVERGFGDSG